MVMPSNNTTSIGETHTNMTFIKICMAMSRSVFAPCPYFRDLMGAELKRLAI